MKYNHVVLGGTFDHFHNGHKAMLKRAAELSDCIAIGLATDDLYKHKLLSESIEQYEVRKAAIEAYSMLTGYIGSLEIIPIFDIFGTTLKDSTFDAIVVTDDTFDNANLINEKRVNLGFERMDIVLVPFKKGKDGVNITSERVRMGQIDRAGNDYISSFRNDLILPPEMRDELRKPLGKVYAGQDEDLNRAANLVRSNLLREEGERLFTIGDISTSSLRAVGVEPNIAVIDNRSRRHDLKDVLVSEEQVSNRPGTISKNAVSKLYKYIADVTKSKRSLTLEIQGEEDLLALPAILLSPLNTWVVYGQYDLGLVVTLVTEEKKDQVRSILSRF